MELSIERWGDEAIPVLQRCVDMRKIWAATITATAVVRGPESIGGCTVRGSVGYKQGDAWGVQDASGSVCAQGRGFTVSGTRTWYSIGSGKSNDGTTVTWGNILSNPSVRAMATSGPVNSVGWWI